MKKRKAHVRNVQSKQQLEAYLPENYRIVKKVANERIFDVALNGDRDVSTYLIEGHDEKGWNLHGYVTQRLQSGMMYVTEV